MINSNITGWSKVAEFSVGGLMWVGFSKRQPYRLLCISSQYTSLVDCNTGDIAECDAECDEESCVALTFYLPDEVIDFSGKKIRDMDISFIPEMKELEVFNFPSNHFTTEQVAWLVAKCPELKGKSLKPYKDFVLWNKDTHKSDIPAVIIVGKRKTTLTIEGNEKKIAGYVAKFEKLSAGCGTN